MSKDTTSILAGGGIGRRRFLQAAGATLAAPALASIPASVARADDTVNLTFWAWTPKTQDQVDLFQKKFPNIKVTWQNVGQGTPHYDKLRNAIKAGTGLPDVAQMEFNSIPSFKALNALADMGSAGANDVKDKFVDWTWKSVSDGNKVYGIPWDSGPMGLLYRKDIFDDNKLDVPDTWDAYSEAALKLAKDKPGTYLTDFVAQADGGWLGALLWQKGARPFHVDGTNLHIQLNEQLAKDWANYWQKLVDAKAVDTKPDWTTEWFANFDAGVYASWITAAWGPIVMKDSMKTSSGKWRAAALPQWNKGDKITSNWGGSTFAAMTTTPHLKEATQFAVFMGSDPEAAKLWNTEQFLFPVIKDVLNDPDIVNHTYDFYGGQAVNQIFAAAEAEVNPTFEFAPFQDYVNQVLNDEIAASLGGKGTIADALDRAQTTVVGYATDQGFTVV
jgi:multiple sugar transport system substrate-binding protein